MQFPYTGKPSQNIFQINLTLVVNEPFLEQVCNHVFFEPTAFKSGWISMHI